MDKEEIEELKREIKALKQANIEYKDRIDKAIEYLEQPYRDNFDYSKSQILEILKGEDNV